MKSDIGDIETVVRVRGSGVHGQVRSRVCIISHSMKLFH
jgi:hypothetical protein